MAIVNMRHGIPSTRSPNATPSAPWCETFTKRFVRRMQAQKHFLWTIVGPDSSYSPFEIHICWNVLRDDKMEPPIQTEYFLSGGATTLIFIVDGTNADNSFVILSPMPANIVVPPDSTTFA